jgi:phospholipid/cholesterol/gamma-HCH transport system substrate-binding protein
MQKHAPSIGRLAVIIGFAISCFAILTYLWVTFGGSVPLQPKKYEINVPFDEATQLTPQADVRVSGISAGKVDKIDLTPDGRYAQATLAIDAQYAPLPADTKAILRAKTLLGETYIELTPGTESGPKVPDGGSLPRAQVADAVQLDEVLRTFDPKTRAGFQEWMQNAAVASRGRGMDLSNAIAELNPTFDGFDQVFRTLDTQQQAVSALFANGATTFNALRGRQGDLRNLILAGDRVFNTIGRRNQDLSAAFRAFPEFLDQSHLTFDKLKTFALNTDPLMQQLTPAAHRLSPTFEQIGRIAPNFRGFFTGLKPTSNRAPSGLEAFRELIGQEFPPLLVALDPFLRSLNPILDGIGLYSPEITALFANATAATNGTLPGAAGSKPHYLRTLAMMDPASLASYPQRLSTSRANAYMAPGAYSQLASAFPSFETRQCGSGFDALLDPNTPNDPNFNARFGGDVTKATDFFTRLKKFAFADKLSSADIPAPACNQQGKLRPLGGSNAAPTTYQHSIRQP